MIDCVADAPVVVIPVTALGEIEAGFALGSRVQENRHDFLNEPFVSVLDVTSETVRHYARIFASSRYPHPHERCVDAAATMECRGCLLNSDYRRDLDYTLLDAP